MPRSWPAQIELSRGHAPNPPKKSRLFLLSGELVLYLVSSVPNIHLLRFIYYHIVFPPHTDWCPSVSHTFIVVSCRERGTGRACSRHRTGHGTGVWGAESNCCRRQRGQGAGDVCCARGGLSRCLQVGLPSGVVRPLCLYETPGADLEGNMHQKWS